jgi:hypothetical protein
VEAEDLTHEGLVGFRWGSLEVHPQQAVRVLDGSDDRLPAKIVLQFPL